VSGDSGGVFGVSVAVVRARHGPLRAAASTVCCSVEARDLTTLDFVEIEIFLCRSGVLSVMQGRLHQCLLWGGGFCSNQEHIFTLLKILPNTNFGYYKNFFPVRDVDVISFAWCSACLICIRGFQFQQNLGWSHFGPLCCGVLWRLWLWGARCGFVW